jgi:hypothetical protein
MGDYKNYTHYELQALRKLRIWEAEMQVKPDRWYRVSKKLQNRFNKMIPDKVHNAITAIVKSMVHAVLFTSKFIKPAMENGSSLEKREEAVSTRMEYYRTTASVEGGIAGWGGLLGALADFPALLTIKLKFLFDVASLYGYDTSRLSERIFLLHVFQLAFSSPLTQEKTYLKLRDWAKHPDSLPEDPEAVDWYRFQQDYRDYLDVAKLLQMLPGVGAAVGLVVNYRLLNKLADTAMMCYRMRWLECKG